MKGMEKGIYILSNEKDYNLFLCKNDKWFSEEEIKAHIENKGTGKKREVAIIFPIFNEAWMALLVVIVLIRINSNKHRSMFVPGMKKITEQEYDSNNQVKQTANMHRSLLYGTLE